MARTFSEQQRSVLDSTTVSMTNIWEIRRTDGVIFRFTDHDTIIEFEGENFSPVDAFSASAAQRGSSIETVSNLELIGILSDDTITDDDIRAGRFDEAEIVKRQVDSRHPWIGSFSEDHYWIAEIKFSSDHWEAQLEGIGRFLQQKIGDQYSHECRHELGDAVCRVDVVALSENGSVFIVDTDQNLKRTKFTATGLTTGSGFFSFGRLTWLTGPNVGIINQVKVYTFGTPESTIELNIPVAFPISPNDTFNVEPGCDKLQSTCIGKFNNILNFGGFPFIPGMDKTQQIPEAKGTRVINKEDFFPEEFGGIP